MTEEEEEEKKKERKKERKKKELVTLLCPFYYTPRKVYPSICAAMWKEK
jgi:hypothetical protein